MSQCEYRQCVLRGDDRYLAGDHFYVCDAHWHMVLSEPNLVEKYLRKKRELFKPELHVLLEEK